MFSKVLLKKIQDKYTEETQKNLKSVVKKINKVIDNDKPEIYDKDIIIKNEDKLYNYFKNMDNIHTSKVYLNFINKLLEFENIKLDKLVNLQNEINKKSDTMRKELNNKKELNEIDVQDIFKFYEDKLKKNNYLKNLTILLRIILFSILNDNALRLTELTQTRINKDDKKTNYIDTDKKILFVRNDKNSKRMKTKNYLIEKPLSDKTIYYINKLYNYYKMENIGDMWLFPSKMDLSKSMKTANIEQMFRTAMTNYYKENNLEKKPKLTGIHSIRHNEVSNLFDDLNINVETLEKLLNNSHLLGHNLTTEIYNYVKIKKDNNKDNKDNKLNK